MATFSINFQFTEIPGSSDLLAIKTESMSSLRLSVLCFKSMELVLRRRDLPQPHLHLMAMSHLATAKAVLPGGGKLYMGFRDDNEVIAYAIYRRSVETVVMVQGFRITMAGLEIVPDYMAIGRTETVKEFLEERAGFKFMELDPFEDDEANVLGYWI